MKNKSSGFTIIEVMIVLAIAGLIMLIVFLAIPSLQRTTRNHDRKIALEYVWSQMHEYYNTHSRYPLTGSGVTCNSRPQCVSFRDSVTTDTPMGHYTIDYADNNRGHSYPYNSSGNVPDSAHDTIVIFPAHRCQRDATAHPPGSAEYPVTSAGPHDNDFKRFAIYVILEHGDAICLDDIT